MSLKKLPLLDEELHRTFKLVCVLNNVPMKVATAEAIRDWILKNNTTSLAEKSDNLGDKLVVHDVDSLTDSDS